MMILKRIKLGVFPILTFIFCTAFAANVPLYAENKESPQNQKQTQPENGFWISKTGKRHNSSCRYYMKSKGHMGAKNEGVACKICGG